MPSQRCSVVAVLAIVAAILLANPSTAVSRAVNISSTWFLPQEGFPVFYRYFHDRITWFEADAVCQFHHANLVTVDTSVQYDATRAYLKELDIANNVWIGLKKSGAGEDFAWTDYKTLSHDAGYWQEQIPKSASPLCAVTDPAADFRWHSLDCGGPEVASFICEMPVPPWARQDNGCMLTSLPSLTVIFLPEQGAVELTSDCGLEGTRRIACKGEANREEMMHQLSCDHGGVSQEDEMMSVSPEVTISSATFSSSSGTTYLSSSTSLSSGMTSLSSGTTSLSSGTSLSSSTTSGGTGGYTAGTRSYTGHSDSLPTRHRRDADNVASSQMISLVKSTTAGIDEATAVHDVTTSAMNAEKETAPSSTVEAADLTTMTPNAEFTSDASTASSLITQEYVDKVTVGSQTTYQDSQLSTTAEMLPYTTTTERNAILPEDISIKPNFPEDTQTKANPPDDAPSTANLPQDTPTTLHEGIASNQYKDAELVNDVSTKDSTVSSTLAPTTLNVLLKNLGAFKTASQRDIVATTFSTSGEILGTEPTVSTVSLRANESIDAISNASITSQVSTVSAGTESTTTPPQQTNITEATEATTVTADDEDTSNFNTEEKSQRSEENNSREEDEEERLKEEERKEKEKKFKEEEDNRRRLFLPTQLRNLPEVVIVPEVPKQSERPSVEEAFEEPGEMVEPEPEVPSRPNRGRQLTRPQTHSFYPYFLNRVLG